VAEPLASAISCNACQNVSSIVMPVYKPATLMGLLTRVERSHTGCLETIRLVAYHARIRLSPFKATQVPSG
jgi:hypothetical protein